MKGILQSTTNWDAPVIAEDMKYGDMPGDRVTIGGNVEEKAGILFQQLLKEIPELLESGSNERVVISVCGGSGVGKSGIASLLTYYFSKLGVDCYTLSGDNYPKRIPVQNDAERLRIFRNGGIKAMLTCGDYTKDRFEILHKLQLQGQDSNPEYAQQYPWMTSYIQGGREALKGYLGTEKEQDFEEVNRIISEFKSGKEMIWLKRMGREETELWYDEVKFAKASILVIEWTHANSDHMEGIDFPILLNSTPKETLAYRMARSRDKGADSPFITMVLEIEQALLESQAKKAKLIVSKQGDLLNFKQYSEIMSEARENK